MVWAETSGKIFFFVEIFAANAIKALIRFFVNVTASQTAVPNLSNTRPVEVLIATALKDIEFNVETFGQLPKFLRVYIAELQGGDSQFLRRLDVF